MYHITLETVYPATIQEDILKNKEKKEEKKRILSFISLHKKIHMSMPFFFFNKIRNRHILYLVHNT